MKKILTFALSGFLMVSGVAHAQVAGNMQTGSNRFPTTVMENFFSTFSPDQIEKVKSYTHKHYAEVKSTSDKILQDRAESLHPIIYSKNFDEKKAKQAIAIMQKDESQATIQALAFLNYIYNDVATEAQKKQLKTTLSAQMPDFYSALLMKSFR